MSGELRVLTVRQPWAWAIVHGGKDVVNRVRNVAGAYRGPIAIHAGLALDEAGFLHRELNRTAWWRLRGRLVFGAIIGVVDFVGVHENSNTQGCMPTGFGDGRLHQCSVWAESGVHHLVLANPRPLTTPIPYRGALGLRTLPDDVAAAVWAEVAS